MFRKQALLVFLIIGVTTKIQAQEIFGKVADFLSGDPITDATISIGKTTTTTDARGTYKLELGNEKAIWILVKASGYYEDSVLFSQGTNEYNFQLSNTGAASTAIEITTSVAKNRKTPVVFSNITGKDIAERLGSADMPMLLNSTPGVYATQSGGGAGDARISIRGFNQRNIAVMIDGIPVNDMENGQVYWSNWFGLGEVTAMTQVQRGLGNSRIANPAVGGTLNIITRGVSDKPQFSANTEFGDSRYRKYSFTANSGRLPGNWGFILSATARFSDGYVDALYDRMYSFYGRVEKKWKHQTLSLTFVGAPQSHGQRSFRAILPLYSKSYAAKLGLDTTINNMAMDKGRRYNQHWGTYTRTNADGTKETITQNERENMFFKPQLYLKHDWKVSKTNLLSTVAYASIGAGGGTSENLLNQSPVLYGTYDFQTTYNLNTKGTAFVSPIDPNYHPTLRKSNGIIQRNVNNHAWLGILSNYHYKINKYVKGTSGIDLRSYVGYHYREVYDLLGGEYFRPNSRDTNPYNTKRIYQKGDKFGFNYDGYVKWGGAFSELEYSRARFTCFGNISGTYTTYRRVDSFRLDSNLKPANTGNVPLMGITIKSGANYNLNRKFNIFANIGYLNRPARFNNVIDSRNKITKNYKNEIVKSMELGLGYKSPILSVDLNGYLTFWNNKPVDALPSYQDADGNTFSYNIPGLSARHTGIEMSAALKPGFGLTIEAIVSIGDWIWTSGSNSTVFDDGGDSVASINFDATGVHVGDAAQKQFGLILRWEPQILKGLYVSFQGTAFAKHFADFEPSALIGDFKRRESFELPNYYFINSSIGYTYKGIKKVDITLYANAQNITNNLYITDAQHRNLGSPQATFNNKNVEVYVSPGLRYTTGIRVTYRL